LKVEPSAFTVVRAKGSEPKTVTPLGRVWVRLRSTIITSAGILDVVRAEVKLTGPVVGEVELHVIATVRGGKRDVVGRVDAGVPQLVVTGEVIRSEGCGKVETGGGGTVGQLSVPLALAGLAGKDSGRGSGCESEDDGGELHLDGDGLRMVGEWKV
jgi:hypothetical protein